MLYCNPIPALNDNYIWLIRDNDRATHAYIVDPGEAQPVFDFLTTHQLTLAGILITHKHQDHVGGVKKIVDKFNVPVYGPKTIDCVTTPVEDGQDFSLPRLNSTLKVMAIPGHTLEHIAFYNKNSLFCGDTLFAVGCGRVFEGTAEQMLNSLHKLASLADHTRIFCAHEYTLNNINFAKTIDPDNRLLIKQEKQFLARLNETGCSLPSLLSIEKSINPFLRCHKPEIITSANQYSSIKPENETDVFMAIRDWKNNF